MCIRDSCLSVLTFGEIRKGIALLPDASRRASLETWLDHELVLRFADRILAIDQAVADRWGRIAAQALSAKSALPVIDGLLAATAMRHNLTLVTRNTKDLSLIHISPGAREWGERSAGEIESSGCDRARARRREQRSGHEDESGASGSRCGAH